MSELYLVRHAQASFGAANYDQLSELGHRQSRWLGDYLKQRKIEFDCFVVGDMHRHHQTMDGISAGLAVDTSDRLEIPGLNEYDFHNIVEVYSDNHADDPLLDRIQQDPTDTKSHHRLLRKALTLWAKGQLPEVAETWIEFRARLQSAQQQIQSLADSRRRILAIGSGGSISAFVGTVLDIPDENIFDLNLQYRNTAISHFYLDSKKLSLSSFNGLPHLDTNEMAQFITYS